MLGEQANQEVDPAEVSPASQERTSGSISTSYSRDIHPMLYAFSAISKLPVARVTLAVNVR